MRKLFFIVVLLFLFSPPAYAITVCSTGADYTTLDDGLSNWTAGNNLELCRGETFQRVSVGTISLGDMSGAKLKAYGTGNNPIILSQSSSSPGIDFGQGSWDGPSETVGIANATFENIKFMGLFDSTENKYVGTGLRFRFNSNNVTIENCEFENLGIGIHIKYNLNDNGNNGESSADNQTDFSVKNNTFKNGTGLAALLGGGPDFYFGYNTITNWGAPNKFSHSLYLGCADQNKPLGLGANAACTQLVEYNTISGGTPNETGQCVGAEIVTHGYVNGLTISNNTISEPNGSEGGCWGILVNPAYSGSNNHPWYATQPELLSNVTISDNFIQDVGNAYIFAENVDGFTVTNNQIFATRENSFKSRGIVMREVPSETALGANRMKDITITGNTLWLRPDERGRYDFVEFGPNLPSGYPANPSTTNSFNVGQLPPLDAICGGLDVGYVAEHDVNGDNSVNQEDVSLMFKLLSQGGTLTETYGPYLRSSQ